jgi:hypothetical protein
MKKARERLIAVARPHPRCLPANKLLETPSLIATPMPRSDSKPIPDEMVPHTTRLCVPWSELQGASADAGDGQLPKQFSALPPSDGSERVIAMPCNEQVISSDGPCPPGGIQLFLDRDIGIARPRKLG